MNKEKCPYCDKPYNVCYDPFNDELYCYHCGHTIEVSTKEANNHEFPPFPNEYVPS